MSYKQLNDQQLRIERIRYNLIVENQISTLDFNENIDKKVVNFLIVTVGIGIMLAWLSSTPGGSNLYEVYNAIKNYIPYGEVLIKFQLPIFLITIAIILKVYALKNKLKKIHFQALLSYSKQDELFKSFIKKLIADREKVIIEGDENLENLWQIIKDKNIADIYFDEADFEDYLEKHFLEYIKTLPLFFLRNFSYLILYNECIENTLVYGCNNGSNEFGLIVSKNSSIL